MSDGKFVYKTRVLGRKHLGFADKFAFVYGFQPRDAWISVFKSVMVPFWYRNAYCSLAMVEVLPRPDKRR